MTDLTGRSLLAVFAHPDDESLACGGLLAWCAERGVRVTLVCATRGEGRGAGDVRARELEAAARVLGVADIVMLDYEDGMLPWVDAVRLEADIRDAIQSRRPDVVITFGEDGLYWHPDHIAVYERTTAASAALGQNAPALYYVTMPPGRMRAVAETTSATSILGISDADAFGALAQEPTLVIETGAYALRKLAAIRCHASQLEPAEAGPHTPLVGGGFSRPGDALALLSDQDALRLLGTEHFRRASIGSTGDCFIEEFGHARSPA